MRHEHRKDERYTDIGRVEAKELCALPGVLDDISLTGCKVHFPVPLSLDMENDYNITIKFSRNTKNNVLNLLCHPQWKRSKGNETEIGFKILTNPNSKHLSSYISSLKESSEDKFDISSMIISHDFTIVR